MNFILISSIHIQHFCCLYFLFQIDRYEALYTELEAIETTVLFDKWFRLDVRPFKHSLLENTKNLTELDKFIKEAEVGVAQDLGNGDYDILVSIMGHLVGVRERIHSTDAMFEPLKATIALVKQYGDDLPETMHLKLQELPEQWESLKKQCDLIRQHVAPLKASEVSAIRKKCIKFETRQAVYREKFKKYSFFNFSCELPYWRLERVNMRLQRLEEEMHQLQDSAVLFEVVIPEFKYMKACRKELRMLKQLWDHICLVRACVDYWKTTPWREVDVENMDIECKKFAKDIRSLDKEMRSWDAYINLDATVKNMLTSLRAVAELQNPSLRERHWGQLLIATKSESSTKSFVTLTLCSACRFEVQRTWSHLESIFIGSDDIRRQLPEDSARFDQIDIDFKELVAEMVANPHVLKATNRTGLFPRLEALQAELTLCEKTLAEYLETKRLAFPRHLTKLFDSIAGLKFAEEESGEGTAAVGMKAKDGEYVEFSNITNCVGPNIEGVVVLQVEKWLMSVLQVMRDTVRARMTDAVVAYEDRPRDQWIGDYPAQVTPSCNMCYGLYTHTHTHTHIWINI
ncbi:Dynein beta chain, ciliary [Portunus trituberculatus]|uniref:Dynein beta chain, ciliary n=1 Tax=Portunus trituberculatus TaxID=210409 RepID=A0A5B7G3L8_PORTR|nr:Dynein beta chain, ciliary [Portunus trituberculatus]